MRKFISLILMLAVAGVVSSCEKNFLNEGNNDFGNVENPIPENENAIEAGKFVG